MFEQAVIDSTVIFRFAPAFVAFITVASFLVVVGAIVAYRAGVQTKAALGVGAIGAFALVISGSISQDRVEVSESAIEQTTGFFWSPTKNGFAYSQVDHVRLTQAKDRKGLEYNVWEVHDRAGGMKRIDVGDLWDDNAEAIVPLLKAKGVRFD